MAEENKELEEIVDNSTSGNPTNIRRGKKRGISSYLVGGLIAYGLVSYIKKLKAENEELKSQATTDGLTGLYNRREFESRLETEVKRTLRFGHPISLLMLDIDYFKPYNDTFGHLQGDVALKEVGSVINHYVREIDSAARYGGEEFAIILPETGKEGALEAAEKLRKRIEEKKIRWHGNGNSADYEGTNYLPEDEKDNLGEKDHRHVTVSVGVESFENKSVDAIKLVGNADLALLYGAKKEGKNRVVFFDPSVHNAA